MKKPNIIFLIQDQMQQQVMQPSSGIQMPNLHSLMADGVQFSRAYTCNAICSPARASLLTGTLPHTHGMVDCTHTVPAYRAEFDASLDTLTAALHEEGYHVSYYGKWHIERSHRLERFGIEDYQTEKHMPAFPVTMKQRITLTTPGYSDKLVSGVFSEDTTHTEEYYIYNRAIEQIDARRKQNRPFCTFISTYAPHDPYCVPEEIYQMYEGRELPLPRSFDDAMTDKPDIYRRMREVLQCLTPEQYREVMRCYYSYCTLVDVQLGRLLDHLKETDLYDDTMIVFLADHGDLMGAHGLMMKTVPPFEEVYRIPLVMKLPGREMAGHKADFYINIYEIAPTVLELAGCRPLSGSHVGESMVPWLKGQRTDSHYAFAEFFGQRYAFTQRIYWQDGLKYVFNAFDWDELYDLNIDPDELVNRSDDQDYAESKKMLCTKMWEHIKRTGDETMLDAEYYPLRIAPVGPGKKQQDAMYSIYNKQF